MRAELRYLMISIDLLFVIHWRASMKCIYWQGTALQHLDQKAQ